MNELKGMIVGDDCYEMYSKALYKGFLECGYSRVTLFATNRLLGMEENTKNILLRAENKSAIGPHIWGLNRKLHNKVKEEKPDFLFFYSTRLIHARTIKKIKDLGCNILIYCNDDPFADYYPKYFWRHLVKSLQYADIGFVYRLKNITDFRSAGCDKVKLLRSYYIAKRNYYIQDNKIENVPKIVFLGHNEKDEREAYIRQLAESGVTVGVMEKSWEDFETDNPKIAKIKDSHKHYNEILNATKIAIVFLSKINNDTYTRRCFEIPATKTMMLAPYTEDLAGLFEENKEIVFFRNKEDFVSKANYYLVHEEERDKIAQAGYERIMKDGHEVKDRVRFIMKCLEESDCDNVDY